MVFPLANFHSVGEREEVRFVFVLESLSVLESFKETTKFRRLKPQTGESIYQVSVFCFQLNSFLELCSSAFATELGAAI